MDTILRLYTASIKEIKTKVIPGMKKLPTTSTGI
jgi:hypothetical protein